MNKTLHLVIQGLIATALLGFILLPGATAAAADGPLAVTETPTTPPTETVVPPTETPVPPTATPTVVSQATVTPPAPTATTPPNNPQPTAPPVVSLVKQISQDRVSIGSVVNYTLTVTNPNDTSVDNVTVQDILPAQVDYLSATSPVGTVSYDAATRAVTVVLGALAARQEVQIVIQARVNANASSASPIINQATITYGTTGGGTTSNQVNAELVPGSLPATGVGPGPREIVTLALILGMAGLTVLALYDRSRKPEPQEQAEIIRD